MSVPSSLQDIRNKVRRITGRPNQAQITDPQIDQYVNTFYIYDMPEHLRLISQRVNYQFVTQPNIAVYDFPSNLYLTTSPPVYIGGYQSYFTQSRENFFRLYPALEMIVQIGSGNGTPGVYTAQLPALPILRGYKRNPPGAYSSTVVPPQFIDSQVIIYAANEGFAGTAESAQVLVDDGLGNLLDQNTGAVLGTIDYIGGAVSFSFLNNVPAGSPIGSQFTPYNPSRPQACCFYQQQFILGPVPDQPYIVSTEAYMAPTALANSGDMPQLNEFWQLLAYGASDKIFTDNADFESAAKFRPLLDEQLKLCQRRTIVQQTSERVASIYSEQSGYPQYPFGNVFAGL